MFDLSMWAGVYVVAAVVIGLFNAFQMRQSVKINEKQHAQNTLMFREQMRQIKLGDEERHLRRNAIITDDAKLQMYIQEMASREAKKEVEAYMVDKAMEIIVAGDEILDGGHNCGDILCEDCEHKMTCEDSCEEADDEIPDNQH